MTGTQATVVGSHPPPETIGGYVVERELGRGGMATVYLCSDPASGNKVAVKVLRPDLGSAVVVERFHREIKFASRLDHPQIPRVLGSGMFGELPFYVMTFIDGESLKARLERDRQLTVDEAVRITREIVVPTAYAHAHGIVHRDIKPANILLSGTDVFVLDFGIARAIAASSEATLTSTGVAVGTPAYMSPEQAMADHHIDERSDVYSLACVTYEMIAGIPPFVGATAQAVMARRFVSQPPPLAEVRELIPPAVERAVMKALCRAPADRWQTIREFGAALGEVGSSSAISGPAKSKPAYLKSAPRWAAIAAGVLGVAFLGWMATHRNNVEDGRHSLEAWKLDDAENSFRRAISKNPGDAAAQLWLGQLLALKLAPVTEWAPLVLRAGDNDAGLSPDDEIRANALARYANSQSPDRCTPLRAMAAEAKKSRPRDFTATVLLADCLSSDKTVVPDSTSVSGYRFASSYQEAANLYSAVLDRHSRDGAAYKLLVPRLSQILWTTKTRIRAGVARGATDANFLAQPTLVADTISAVPFKAGGSGSPFRSDAAGQARFVAKNLDVLRTLSERWVAASADDPDAEESLSSVLEAIGRVDGSGVTALTTLRAARNADVRIGDPKPAAFLRRIRLANSHVRLLVKAYRFREARVLADSALSWTPSGELNDSTADVVRTFRTGLLGITGRIGSVLDEEEKSPSDYWTRLPDGEVKKLPAELAAYAIRLETYALFGAPRDSIEKFYDRVSEKIDALVPTSEAANYKRSVLQRPMRLAIDVTGTHRLAVLGPSSDPFILAVRALDANNVKLAAKYADSLAALHGGYSPGEITMDVVLNESWLRAATGDSASAARSLDKALGGLSSASTSLLKGPLLGTALVRAMRFRAELAEKAGDTATSKRWSDATRELWSGADSEIRSSLRPPLTAH